MTLVVKNLPANSRDIRDVWSLGGEDPLEERVATQELDKDRIKVT